MNNVPIYRDNRTVKQKLKQKCFSEQYITKAHAHQINLAFYSSLKPNVQLRFIKQI